MSVQDLLLHIAAEGTDLYRVELRPTAGGNPLAWDRVSAPDRSRWEGLYLEPLRRLQIPQGRLVSLGRELARLAFPEPVRAAFLEQLEVCASAPLRLRLCVAPTELAALPWEYLSIDPGPGFLSLHPSISLFRQPTVAPQQLAPLKPTPLRVLLATADPGTGPWPRLTGREREVSLVQGALRPLVTTGQAAVTVVEHITPALLRGYLQGPFQVLHFCGHARFDPAEGGALILEGLPVPGADRAQVLPAQELAEYLQSGTVRLVLLSACETAAVAHSPIRSLGQDRLSVAQALTQAGLPAVVAMQAPLPDITAPSFMHALYVALATGQPLDQAVQAGRWLLRGSSPDWGVPVLFLSVEDPRLFLSPEPADIPSPVPPSVDLSQLQFTHSPIRPFAHSPIRLDLSQLPAAPFFQGREAEIADVAHRLRPGAVVRLAGEGGIGKTALAVEVAQRQASHFPGGVFGLALEPLPSRERVVQCLGRWLLGESFGGLSEEERESAVVTALRSRAALLVLDNFETLGEAMPASPEARALGQFLGRCVGGGTALLLTGREPSRLPGEQVVTLEGLTPEAAASLFRLHATQREVDSEADLRDLLAALGHHPLAVELVARDYDQGWESLAELRDRLATHLPDGINLYEADRHATLRACFDASFDRLDPALQGFFLDLGLFAGPFTAEAASTVTGLANARGALEHLAQRSLVRRPTEPSDGYRLLPVVRLYAQERAAAAGRDQAAPRERFVQYYAERATWFFDRFFQQPEAATLARQSWPNLIRAADWATGQMAVNLAYRLGWLVTEFGELDTAIALYERVLTIPPTSPALAAKAQRSLGGIAHQRGQWEAAEAHYQEAGQAFEKAHDLRGQATVRHEQARLRADQGDLAAAEGLYNDALALFQQASDPYGEARTRYSRAVLDRLRGEFARAQEDCEAVLTTFQELGERRMMAAVQQELGYLAFVRGEYGQARARYEASLALNWELGTRLGVAVTQHNLGELYAEEGDLTKARQMQEEAAAIFAEMGHRQGQAETSRELGRLDRLEGDLTVAERRCQEALIGQTQIGDRRGQAATLLELAALRQAQGRFDEALSWVNESQSLAEQAEDRLGQAHAPLRRAEVLAAAGDLPGALAAAWESWQRYTALGAAGAERAQQVLQTLRTRLGAAFEGAWTATVRGAPPEWLA